MKTKNIIISFVLTMVTMLSVQAQTLTIDDVYVQAGGELELMVKADNVSSYIATGFYVELPNGFSAAGVTATKSSGLQSDHVVKAGATSDTKLRVAIYSTKNSALSIASSPLCTLKLKAPSKAGTYTGRITGVEFSNANHNLSTAATKTFTITVVNPSTPGDVNDDQAVDVADIATIISVMSGSSIADNADVNGDGAVDVADIATVISIMAGQTVIIPGDNGHEPAGVEAIDLGLPSGTKWANMNVGAEKPSDYGLYFAWGETKGYATASSNGRQFNWASYKWMNSGQSAWQQINKYQVIDGMTNGCWYSNGAFIGDRNDMLALEDDAAHVNWGGEWVMPSKLEIAELLDYTTSEWTTLNGIYGRIFTSLINGKSIFLPAAGNWENDALKYQSTMGTYWTSSVDPDYTSMGCCILFSSGSYDGYSYIRCSGFSIRPIIRGDGNSGGETPAAPEHAPAGAEAVDLGLSNGTLWANMNVGAEKPEDDGLFFAWGDTTGYSPTASGGHSFNWATYKWMNQGQSIWQQVNKYQVADGKTDACWYSNGAFIGDGETTLLLVDDAAHANWGGEWVMPTNMDFSALLDGTTNEWTTVNGVNGYKFTSKKNGNSIFFPAAGYWDGDTPRYPTQYGGYWTSSVSPSNSSFAYCLFLSSGSASSISNWRSGGMSVRPVIRK